MAAPLNSDKQSVDLAAAGSVRGSRIRRDPVRAGTERAAGDGRYECDDPRGDLPPA